MHEIYMLAVLFNASRPRASELTRDQRLRDEQAFYDRHSGHHWPRFRKFAGLATGVPVAVVAVGLVLAATRVFVH